MNLPKPATGAGLPSKPESSRPTRSLALRFIPRSAEDRDFLPAALEILETPPSVVSIAFIWLICAVVATAIGWAYFGKLDVYAVAQGKIQPIGRSKVVQPLEPGKIRTVLVDNGAAVKEGDVLIELDPTDAGADQEKLTQDLDSSNAEASRRRAAIAAAGQDRPVAPAVDFASGTGDFIRQREERALAADLAQLVASRQSLDAQLAQQTTTESKLRASIAEREKLLTLSQERIDMRETLSSRGAGSRSLVIDALTQFQTDKTAQVSEEGQLRETVAAMETTRRKYSETVAQFVADQTQKLVEAERKRDQVQQDLIKAKNKYERMRLRAPISGTVQQLAVTTVGQVVTGGQTLMTVVPLDAPLEIETMVQNKDVGFVQVGQLAIVKIDAFPFTRYGTIDGTVTKVSSEAVDMRDAPNLSDASASVKVQGASPNSPTNKPDLAFPATIKLVQRSIEVNGQDVLLSPGMTATVEIKTGARRVIDYVLSPLREVVSQAAHER
jgi:hemolysin D